MKYKPIYIKNWNEIYFKNYFPKENAYCIFYPDGSKAYFNNGKHHRENGPAVEFSKARETRSGENVYYLDGKYIGSSINGYNDEQFKQYIKEKQMQYENMLEKSLTLLNDLKSKPKMFASTKEGLLNIVITALFLLKKDFDSREFFKNHLKTKGNVYSDSKEDFTNEWVEKVIDSALKILKDE